MSLSGVCTSESEENYFCFKEEWGPDRTGIPGFRSVGESSARGTVVRPRPVGPFGGGIGSGRRQRSGAGPIGPLLDGATGVGPVTALMFMLTIGPVDASDGANRW